MSLELVQLALSWPFIFAMPSDSPTSSVSSSSAHGPRQASRWSRLVLLLSTRAPGHRCRVSRQSTSRRPNTTRSSCCEAWHPRQNTLLDHRVPDQRAPPTGRMRPLNNRTLNLSLSRRKRPLWSKPSKCANISRNMYTDLISHKRPCHVRPPLDVIQFNAVSRPIHVSKTMTYLANMFPDILHGCPSSKVQS